MREISLNGVYDFHFLEGMQLEDKSVTPDFQASDHLCVPISFDMTPDYYCKRGTALFRREFSLSEAVLNAAIAIDGMGLRLQVWLDGKDIGKSQLAYSQLSFDTGPLEKGSHTLVLAVDNVFDDKKVKLFYPYYDFYAFGGLYHGVSIVLQKHRKELSALRVRTLNYKTGQIDLEAVFWNEAAADGNFVAKVAFDKQAPRQVAFTNFHAQLAVPACQCWSPANPHLHRVCMEYDGSSIEAEFGVRQVSARNRQIFLNGEPIYLKGFNRHESDPLNGAATTEAAMLADLQHLRSLHCNFVRGCHYQQSPRFLQLCDRLGILVWEEALGWGNNPSQMSDPEYIDLQVEMAQQMLRSSINHPCVIISSFQNENHSNTQEGKEMNELLVDTLRKENSGHLITFACCHVQDDISNYKTDIIAYNIYPGWCGNTRVGILQDIPIWQAETIQYFRQTYGEERPILVGEMGICGIYGCHDEARAQWSEEFQAMYLDEVLKTVLNCDQLCGIAIWQLNDSKSYLLDGAPLRVKPLGMNLAGVYDQYRRPKLAAQTVKKWFAKK